MDHLLRHALDNRVRRLGQQWVTVSVSEWVNVCIYMMMKQIV